VKLTSRELDGRRETVLGPVRRRVPGDVSGGDAGRAARGLGQRCTPEPLGLDEVGEHRSTAHEEGEAADLRLREDEHEGDGGDRRADRQGTVAG
jgi:hypothetical protein